MYFQKSQQTASDATPSAGRIELQVYCHTRFVKSLSKYRLFLIDPSHKSRKVLDKYPTMHHFVTEMCTHMHILLQNGVLWDMRLMHWEICVTAEIATFMGTTWSQPGSCRPQISPMLAPWTMLSGRPIKCVDLAKMADQISRDQRGQHGEVIYTYYKVWGEIAYPFPDFNGAALQILELISNFIPHLTGRVITHPCSV